MFTSSLPQFNDDDALGDVVVAVVDEADAGLILSISGGTQLAFTVCKVNDDDALGDVFVAVIDEADSGLILTISEGFEVYDVVALSVRLVTVICIHDGS